MAGRCQVTWLRLALADYLALRRALGYRLCRPGKALEAFVEFMECQGAPFITTALASRWARLPARVHPATWAGRLGLVRRFARHCQAVEPRNEVPPDGLLASRRPRRPPYIWSDDEIQALLAAARRLSSPHGLRPLTYETFFGLVSATGLRISEALGLEDTDVDRSDAVLTIRNTKFGKTRLVPVHRSTCEALRRYGEERDRRVPSRGRTAAFFMTERSPRLSESAVRYVFRELRADIGYSASDGRRRPRIHDLRHYSVLRIIPSPHVVH